MFAIAMIDTGCRALGRCEGAQTGLDNLGARTREKASDNAQLPFWSKQRPGYVFSGLVRCGVSGGGFSKISAAHLGCSNERNKGVTVCDNRGVDDLSAHREKASLHQRRLEALKQNFDRRLVIDLRPVSASRKFQIEFALDQRQPQEAHERKTVLDEIFRPLVR
jgi:hypothetical protein